MVLSNKKLKQKLRAELSQSLAESVAKPVVNGDASESRSLKELMGSSTQRPRVSKREKRRKTVSLVDSDEKKDGEEEGESQSVTETQSKKGKRKRDYLKEEEDGVSNMVENGEAKQPKRNNKKKKKKKNKKKTTKNEEGDKKDEITSEEHGVSVENKNIESQPNADVGVKVYVGGIPYYSTEDDIRSYFEGCGTIVDVDCMKFPETGKFRGIAILTFKTEAAAKYALEMDGSDMCGFFLTLQPYKPTRSNKAQDFSPQMVEGYNRVYLGNLSWDITEDAIRDFFSSCDISSIRFGTDKETGEFKGFAHVDFSNGDSLKNALKLDQAIVCGRPVKIRCAVPAKGSKINPSFDSMPKESKINPSFDSMPKESKINPGFDTMPKESKINPRFDSTPKESKINPISKFVPNEPKGSPKLKLVIENSQPEEAPIGPVVSGKIRRRTCYECGEKGHLSTDCPKKQSGFES